MRDHATFQCIARTLPGFAIAACALYIAGCENLRFEDQPQSPPPPVTFMVDESGEDQVVEFHEDGPLDLKKALGGYRPPPGISGKKWEATLDEFNFLYPTPVSAQTYFSRGYVVDIKIFCTGTPCKFSGVSHETEGEGSHTMAEYWNPAYKFEVRSRMTWPDDRPRSTARVVFHTSFWMMCASAANGNEGYLRNISSHLRWCGLRSYFDTESLPEIMKTKDVNFVSRYDHVLNWLVRQFGAPKGYENCYKVTITTADGELIEDERLKRKCALKPWSWCPPGVASISTSCPVSLTLTYDKRAQRGVVIWATKPLWHFAYAGYESEYGDPRLYELLHAVSQGGPRISYCQHSIEPFCESRPVALSPSEIRKYQIPAKTIKKSEKSAIQ